MVEVTADKAAEFGIQWNILDPKKLNNNQTQLAGGTNFTPRGNGTNLLDAQVSLGSLAQGLNLGIIRGAITIPGLGTITNLALLARALQSDANTNILSTPNLLTLDNEEAKIVVGQNVPFITGQYAVTAPRRRRRRFRPSSARTSASRCASSRKSPRRLGAHGDLRGGLAHPGHVPTPPGSSPPSARSSPPWPWMTARSSFSAG